MRSVEVEGNSRVDATRRAIELLGADIDDVKVEVIKEEPRPVLGFLGFKRVTVRVTLVEENVLEEAGKIIQNVVSRLPVPVEARVAMHKNAVSITLISHELRQFQKQEDIADAIGHVVELILNRKATNKVTVKAAFPEDARSREDELTSLAKAAAKRVTASGKPENLHPMPPRERRIIHMTLERDDRVSTESAGKGNDRHVVVFPAAARKPAHTPEDKRAGDARAGGDTRARRPSRQRRKAPAGPKADVVRPTEEKPEGDKVKRRRPRRRTRPKAGEEKKVGGDTAPTENNK